MQKKNVTTFISVVVSLVVVGIFLGGDFFGRLLPQPAPSPSQQEAAVVQSDSTLTQATVPDESLSTVAPGVKIFDVREGEGDTAKMGDSVSVQYIGAFIDWKVFDTSLVRGVPLPFQLGGGNIIPGFEQGVAGMRVGGMRHIVLSPEVAYGVQGIKGPDGNYLIPPNTTLVFDVELVSITR